MTITKNIISEILYNKDIIENYKYFETNSNTISDTRELWLA